MRKNKVFIACDTTDIKKLKIILKETRNKKIIFGYKFGLEFLNSKNGRKFVGSLKKLITFGDYKLSDIPNTCSSAIKAVSDLNFNYITIHISSGLNALKAAKKAADPVEQVQNKFSAAEVGWRMIIELTAGVFIGFGVGYGLDFLFDSKPVFILIMTLFGFAAGVKTMMRSARELQNKELAAQYSSEKENVDG